jgi:cbb3-type cytochrome oxidase maturation protein
VVTLAVQLGWILFGLAFLLGLAAWCIYLWAVGDGQFKDIEEPARNLLSQDARD